MPPRFGGGPKCARCFLTAYPFESVSYSGSVYHAGCFSCELCKQRITNVVSVTELNGAIFHKSCFGRRLQASGGKFAEKPTVKKAAWLANLDLTKPLDIDIVEKIFNDYDKDGDGSLDRREASLFLEAWCKQANTPFSPATVNSFFSTFDANKDGQISKSELIAQLSAARGEEKAPKPESSTLEVKTSPGEPVVEIPPLVEEKQEIPVDPPALSDLVQHEPAPPPVVPMEEHASLYSTYAMVDEEGEVKSAGNYDNIELVAANRNQEPGQERSQISKDDQFRWQERFETILEMPSDTSKQKLEKAKALQALNNEFCEQAKHLAKELIRDSFLPKAERAHKPLSGMGVAGGEKYVAKGMFIKMPKDVGLGIYGGDMGAGKAAKHEINSLQALIDCDVPQLFFPLMCCVTYQGFRLVCSSLIDGLGKNTLVYGSQDAGYTIHCSDPDLNQKVEQACVHLGLAAHNSISNEKKCQVLYGPADLEGHVVQTPQKKKFYLLDFARLMPPESPPVRQGLKVPAVIYNLDGTTTSTTTDNVNSFVMSTIVGDGALKRLPLSEGILFFREPGEAPNALASELASRDINGVAVLVAETGKIFYELLRPEIVKSCDLPLSSDAFSGFGSCKLCFGVNQFCPHGGYLHNDLVTRATHRVFRAVRSLANQLESRLINLADCLALVRELHRAGVNLRWMGLLLRSVTTPYIANLILREMVCRTVRQILAAKQRRIVGDASRLGWSVDKLEEHLRIAGLELFNLTLSGSAASQEFWEKQLPKSVGQKFGIDYDDGSLPRSQHKLRREVLLKFPLFSRLQELTGFKFTPELNQQLFQDSTAFDKEEPFTLAAVAGFEVRVQKLQFDENINFLLHQLSHLKEFGEEIKPSFTRMMSFKTESTSARMVYHQMASETFGPEHPFVIDSCFKLSLDLRRTSSIDAARSTATHGLKSCLHTFGSFSHQYIMGLTTLGEIEMEARNYPAAISIFGQALERANRLYGGKGNSHPLLGKLCAYLGRLNMLHGDKQTGTLYLGRSYTVYEHLYGRKVSDYLTPVITMGKGEQIGTALGEMAFTIRSVCDENGLIEEGEVVDGVLALAGDFAQGLPPGSALSAATIIERIRNVVSIIEDIDGVPRGYFMVDSDEGQAETPTEKKRAFTMPPNDGPCGLCGGIATSIAADALLHFWVRSVGPIRCEVGPEEKGSAQISPGAQHAYDVVSPGAYASVAYTGVIEPGAYGYVEGASAYSAMEENKDKEEIEVGPKADEPENTDWPGVALELRHFISRFNVKDDVSLYRVSCSLARAGPMTVRIFFSDAAGAQTASYPVRVNPAKATAARTQLRVEQSKDSVDFALRARDAFGNCSPSLGSDCKLECKMIATLPVHPLHMTIPQHVIHHPNNIDWLVRIPLRSLSNNCTYSIDFKLYSESVRGCPIPFKSPDDTARRYCAKMLLSMNDVFVPLCPRCSTNFRWGDQCVFCQKPNAKIMLKCCASCGIRSSCFQCDARVVVGSMQSAYAKICSSCELAGVAKACLKLL